MFWPDNQSVYRLRCNLNSNRVDVTYIFFWLGTWLGGIYIGLGYFYKLLEYNYKSVFFNVKKNDLFGYFALGL